MTKKDRILPFEDFKYNMMMYEPRARYEFTLECMRALVESFADLHVDREKVLDEIIKYGKFYIDIPNQIELYEKEKEIKIEQNNKYKHNLNKVFEILRIHQNDDDFHEELKEEIWEQMAQEQFDITHDEFNRLKNKLERGGKIIEINAGYWMIMEDNVND